MAIKETAETWVRIDLFCDGLGEEGTCVLGTGDELQRISDVAPTPEGARTAILNRAVKSYWRIDPKLQRWLCPECVRARDAAERAEDVPVTTDSPASVPQKGQAALEEPFCNALE